MKAPLFYAPGLRDAHDRFTLDEASSRHCVQVLRHRPGDTVLLTDGEGTRAVAVIETAGKKHCMVVLAERERLERPAPPLAVAIAFTKHPGRVEWFLEKATEIGITEIFPLRTARSEKMHAHTGRLRAVMVSAMLQSRQYHLPVLHETTALEALVENSAVYASRFMAHCEDSEKNYLSRVLTPGAASLVMIGPEGDFTPAEIALASGRGFRAVSLGDTRLRTETAGIVACTLLAASRQ
jgi:16S rRNA (uracil1498-N3)-methyltransferase